MTRTSTPVYRRDAYPLDRPGDAAYRSLVERCRRDLTRDGMFNLDSFVAPETCADLCAMLLPRSAAEGFRHARRHNIYFRDDLPLAADHPALRKVETINRTLCADQLQDTALAALYLDTDFIRFLADVMDKPALFPMADALAPVNVMAYHAGEALNWHFDRSEFTTTLLLQAPEQGGAFEYRTDLRSADEPNYDGVARLLRGEDPDQRSLTLAPGTLNVFRGRNTPHRVTPVEGDRARLIAVFSYFEQPGVRFTEAEQRGFYGRTA